MAAYMRNEPYDCELAEHEFKATKNLRVRVEVR
jgi:hypothetical protein